MTQLLRRATALALTIALGIVSRLRPLGHWVYDKSLGDVLYAVAAYLALALVFRLPVRVLAPLAFTVCLAIECFQATGIPARHANLLVVRWLIGTDFAIYDIVCYAIGVGFIAVVDWLVLSPTR